MQGDRKGWPRAFQGNGRYQKQGTQGPGNGVIPRGHPKEDVLQWTSSRVLSFHCFFTLERLGVSNIVTNVTNSVTNPKKNKTFVILFVRNGFGYFCIIILLI